MFGAILTAVRYLQHKLPAHGYRKIRQSRLVKRPLFSRCRGLIFVLLLFLTVGCSDDLNRQDEIRRKVIAGEYEEAELLAHKYFADDKGILLITLEYIAVQKDKAHKKAYTKHVKIENLHWSTDPSGDTRVAGKLLNTGDKTITGFGIKAVCRSGGEVIREARARRIAEIRPGAYEDFEWMIEGWEDCDDLTAIVENLGLKD